MKVAFKWWPREANEEDNFFKKILTKKFDAEFVNEKEADVVFFSTFNGTNSRKMPSFESNAVKIFWTGENCRIDMEKCDFAFGFDYEREVGNQNYLRIPLYVYYGAGKDLIKTEKKGKKFFNRKFCNYIYSKDAPERVNFFSILDKYEKIDAPGRSMNNSAPIPPSKLTKVTKAIQFFEAPFKNYNISSMLSRHVGDWREAIIKYQQNYKFTLAFENSSYSGYTTEKIYHPMLADSIPIYWGNPEISRDFNTKSFVNCHDYNDFEKVKDLVIELNENEKKYLKTLNEPWLKGNKLNKWMDTKRIEKQFERIFD